MMFALWLTGHSAVRGEDHLELGAARGSEAEKRLAFEEAVALAIASRLRIATSWDPQMDVTGEPTHLVMAPPSPTRTKGAQDVGFPHSGLVRSSIMASMA